MYTSGETIGEQKTMASIQELCNKIPEVELRDLFAMSALQGMLQGRLYPEAIIDKITSISYEYADSMLEARSKK